MNSYGIPPKTGLVESILESIFHCQNLVFISITYTAGIESKFYRGDIAGAENASRTAKMLVLLGSSFGLFLTNLFVLSGGLLTVGAFLNQ